MVVTLGSFTKYTALEGDRGVASAASLVQLSRKLDALPAKEPVPKRTRIQYKAAAPQVRRRPRCAGSLCTLDGLVPEVTSARGAHYRCAACDKRIFVRRKRRTRTFPIHDEKLVRRRCACGCLKAIDGFDSRGRARRFRPGHNTKSTDPVALWQPVLEALQRRGRARPSDVAKDVGRSANAVNLVLFRAHKLELVRRIAYPSYGLHELTIEGMARLAEVQAGKLRRPTG